jgi:hypothetical protein
MENIIEQVDNQQLYRFCFELKYDSDWTYKWPVLESVFAYTREEADEEMKKQYHKRGSIAQTLTYVSKAGKPLDDVEAGDNVLYRTYGGQLVEAVVERTTQRYIYLHGHPNRFRKDGSEVSEFSKRSIRRYDEREYKDYWKNVANKRRLTNVKRIDWLHIEDDLFNEVYAFLEAKGIVPHESDDEPKLV